MKEAEFTNVNDIHEFLKKYTKKPAFKYRGQSDSQWKLLSKAGRYPHISKVDKEIFRNWKRRAVSYLPRLYNSEIEYLSVAQHTGLITRLLDWSHSPLIGLFFAVSDNLEKDGALYVLNGIIERIPSLERFDPYDIKKPFIIYQPLSTINRLDNQFGYFTIQQDINIPLEYLIDKRNLLKIKIKKEIKMEILFMLNQYGINNLTVYPDLEGLSKHLNWFYENYSEWDSRSDII
jgi:hypothetical protein